MSIVGPNDNMMVRLAVLAVQFHRLLMLGLDDNFPTITDVAALLASQERLRTFLCSLRFLCCIVKCVKRL